MAEKFQSPFEHAEWDAVFDALEGPVKESLARRMGVSGARIVRDEAKRNALIPKGPWGAERRGAWANSFYAAYEKKNIVPNEYSYNVGWNHQKYSGGYWIEFGHLRPYAVYKGEDGNWYTDKSKIVNKKVPAYPALRPAFDNIGNDALRAMLETGRVELPKLLKEHIK